MFTASNPKHEEYISQANHSAMSTDLQLVPESLLKKRHDLDALKARRAAALIANPRTSRKRISDKSKVVRIIKPETLLVQARARKNAAIRYNRVARKGMQKRASNKTVVKNKYWDGGKEEEVEESEVKQELHAGDTEEKNKSESKPQIHEIPYKSNCVGASTIFAILIRTHVHTTPKTISRTLSSLRLRKVHDGVFLQYTPSIRKMLHLVEPYVLYGIPSAETISDLVRRRGFCRIDGKRVQISDNNVIEEQLGEAGLICVEDIVAVITAGDSETFGKVSKFLWPFRMSATKSKFQKKMLDLKDGKLYGDQGEVMNGYIREML